MILLSQTASDKSPLQGSAENHKTPGQKFVVRYKKNAELKETAVLGSDASRYSDEQFPQRSRATGTQLTIVNHPLEASTMQC